MKRKGITLWNLALTAIVIGGGIQAGTITGKAAFDAPYYDMTTSGGSFDGNGYTINGATVANAFFCDGTDTYYLQADGTTMKDRLTYHPDGKHVIYFDTNGHEVFNNFAHVTHSIEGKEVDDYCYFDVYGHMYVNVLTYDQSGTKLYYINPYGVMEHSGVFVLDTGAANYNVIAGGCTYGYANPDGTVSGFYRSYEDAVNNVTYENVEGEWRVVNETTYNASGSIAGRDEYQYDAQGRLTEKRSYDTYVGDGDEHLSYITRYSYDVQGNPASMEVERYGRNDDGTWCVDTVTTEEYDAGQRKLRETTRQYNYSAADTESRNKIVSSYQHIYEYRRQDTAGGYIDTIKDHTNYYEGDLTTFTHDNTLWETKTYENGRLVRDAYRAGESGNAEDSYTRYEYGESEEKYNPETGTTDCEYTEDCYRKTRPDGEEFLAYHRVTSVSMADGNNGTKTVRDYDEAGTLTGIAEYRIINGEEISQSDQRYSNAVGVAYQYLSTDDAEITKEYHRVYSAEWSVITAVSKNITPYLCHPEPGDTVSYNTSNTYTADWTKLVFETEGNPATWKYIPSEEETWKQTKYTIATYRYFATK